MVGTAVLNFYMSIKIEFIGGPVAFSTKGRTFVLLQINSILSNLCKINARWFSSLLAYRG